MRALFYGSAVSLVLIFAAALLAQQRAAGLPGSVSPGKLQFKPIDTSPSKLATPLPTLPVQKKPFSLSSLIPSFLKPKPSPAALPRRMPTKPTLNAQQ
jgi:hypothetical protein